MSDDELMDISLRVSGKLSQHSTGISLNGELWKRVKAVYDDRDRLDLLPEDAMLLERTYDSFARNGAKLEGEQRDKYREHQSLDSVSSCRDLSLPHNIYLICGQKARYYEYRHTHGKTGCRTMPRIVALVS